MGFIIPFLRSPMKEELHQQVPENDATNSSSYNTHGACGGVGARMANELGGMMFGDEEEMLMLKWDMLEMKEEEISFSPAFWDKSVEPEETVTSASLNLNLNYQEVSDAWSNRCRPLLSRDYYFRNSPTFPQCRYMGEVPEMEAVAEGSRRGWWSERREASVMRYKEKRQSRLFSNRIRYQVRKLNADSRPRLKGRFVKRACVSE